MTKHKSQAERQAQILAAARACFIENGYPHTRVDDIAARAGLSKGGVYFHFKSKRDIFDALLQQQQAKTATTVRDLVAQDISTVERLRLLGMAMMNSFVGGDDHGKFLIVLAEMGIRDEEVMSRVREAHKVYVEVLAETIRQGQANGELRDVDPALAAAFMKMLMDGLEQGVALGYDVDTEAFAQVAFDILFRGLTAG